MILALLAAAQVAAAPPIAEKTPNLYNQPAHCPAVVAGELERQKVAFRGQPPAGQYAVERKLDGCGVPTPIGYHPPYLLPGKADPASKPSDAPERRR